MGYIYTHDGKLCCDICGKPKARKHKCPYGWCQPTAICKDCWEKPEVKQSMKKEAHAKCKEVSDWHTKQDEKKDRLYSEGKFVRCSAIRRDDISTTYNVEVTFRNNDTPQAVYKKVLMAKETYDSFPLLEPKTIEDYEEKGVVIPLKDIDKAS